MDNRFKKLRYYDKYCNHMKYSMDELAEKLQISKATVFNIEASDDYDAKISTIKSYKKVFPEVSYDYLLGATGTKEKQYSRIEEELPFDNDFYNNLIQLFKIQPHPEDIPSEDNPFSREYIYKESLTYMLDASLNNPDALLSLIKELFFSMKELYQVEHSENKTPSANKNPEFYKSTEYKRNEIHFRMTQAITTFLLQYVYPLLEHHLKDVVEEENQLFQKYMENNVAPF